jgi:hypothetical protein
MNIDNAPTVRVSILVVTIDVRCHIKNLDPKIDKFVRINQINSIPKMIYASAKSRRTHNPIRAIVDNIKPPVNHPKPLLNLSLGNLIIHVHMQPYIEAVYSNYIIYR